MRVTMICSYVVSDILSFSWLSWGGGNYSYAFTCTRENNSDVDTGMSYLEKSNKFLLWEKEPIIPFDLENNFLVAGIPTVVARVQPFRVVGS